ncbi:hypothetical protein SAMD00023353_4400830 [Rosellinia necatrix]|uniref:Dimeric alpha-beta barrel n=1 Tax=Rosellinia necatrix TaxID=77044 RepID=A0A1W2TNM2_ROSNE|nr:hypothetical protein SAMD00023353_4400830 [Rosellinia necatrix]
MAILEIVLPSLKKDASLMKDFEEKLAPQLTTKLAKAGAKNGLLGPLATEDGRDVSGEYRQILLLEWESARYFDAFVASADFAEFAGELKAKYAAAPARPTLFDPADGGDELSSIFGGDAVVVEYLAVKPRDASEAGVEAVLTKLRSGSGGLARFGAPRVAVGSSANLETREVAVVGVYASDAELDAAKTAAARQELLADLAGVADVTNFVARVKKILPLA